MQGACIEVNGTLRPDGTLILDGPPKLPAGRVRVTVQPLAEPTTSWGNFWMRMQAIWDAQEARGHTPRSVEAVEAEREAQRDESEQEIRAALRIHEESQRARQKGGQSVEQPG